MYNFLDTQEWVPVHTLHGHEACIEYYVNRSGEIKSTKGCVERLLKLRVSKNGYPTVNLTQRVGRGKLKTCLVHVLVAFAFIGNPPTPYGKSKGCSVVRHLNGDKSDCSVNNLEWVQRKSC